MQGSPEKPPLEPIVDSPIVRRASRSSTAKTITPSGTAVRHPQQKKTLPSGSQLSGRKAIAGHLDASALSGVATAVKGDGVGRDSLPFARDSLKTPALLQDAVKGNNHDADLPLSTVGRRSFKVRCLAQPFCS